MLTVTTQAARMIRDLIDRAHLPAGAGLRIARRDDHPALAMTLTAEPGHNDQVCVEHGAPIFLGPVAAERVADQTLDGQITDSNSAFYLRG